MKLKQGLVQVYHGSGKGKSTAAFGLAIRAAGQGLRVCIIQFMKESVAKAGEVETVKKLDHIEVRRFGQSFVEGPSPSPEKVKEQVGKGIAFAREAVKHGYDLVILDEINVAVHLGVADLNEVLKIIKEKAPGVELVLTGRYPPPQIIEAADLVTEMKLVKHPFEKGIKARRGIEF